MERLLPPPGQGEAEEPYPTADHQDPGGNGQRFAQDIYFPAADNRSAAEAEKTKNCSFLNGGSGKRGRGDQDAEYPDEQRQDQEHQRNQAQILMTRLE